MDGGWGVKSGRPKIGFRTYSKLWALSVGLCAELVPFLSLLLQTQRADDHSRRNARY